MSDNSTFGKLCEFDGPITVERFIELTWFGQKTIHDLEGEDWCDILDFQAKLRQLRGEREEE